MQLRYVELVSLIMLFLLLFFNGSINQLQSAERSKIIYEAVLLLETISAKEAERLWMWLNDQSYSEMASRELAGRDVSERELNLRENSIRKQFTCANTGTLAKFRIILERQSRAKGLNMQDIL